MGIDDLRHSRYWTKREGRAALSLWRASGEPLATFAHGAGLSRTRLEYWAKQLGTRRPSAAIDVKLAPVTIVAPAPRGAITIELRSGRVVRIEGDVDDALLARVIVIAERAGC